MNRRIVLLSIPSTKTIYDSFGRANGALGFTENEYLGKKARSLTWTGATWTISSNKAINTPIPLGDLIVNGGFAADTDWTKQAGWTIAGNVGVGTATDAVIYQDVGTLHRWAQIVYIGSTCAKLVV